MSESNPKRVLAEIRKFLVDRFNILEDKANDEDIIENIRKSIEFKGANVWILIFAVFTASIGLNVNSTAVIIGAMLISPLMGPILGIGLSVGINDFELIKKSFKNLAIMTSISLLASMLYFSITPINMARSELLARTEPSTWDVFIALFGGLAGMVANTRKDRYTNVIPGVAIATALMPPLCTAGYGLATLQWSYFLGAFYLFFINSVFIATSAYIVTIYTHLPKKHFLDAKRESRVKFSLWTIVILTIIPSIFLAYGIVQRSVFENNSNRFLSREFSFDNTHILKFNINAVDRKIDVILVGDNLDSIQIANIRSRLSDYQIADASLIIKQGSGDVELNMDELRQGLLQDMLIGRQKQIDSLEDLVANMRLSSGEGLNELWQNVFYEMQVLNPSIKGLSAGKGLRFINEGDIPDTTFFLSVKSDKALNNEKIAIMEQWLRVRLNSQNIILHFE